MTKIAYPEISLINAAPVDPEGLALGCQGVILYGESTAEIHTVFSGFLEGNDNGYLVINKSVVSTSDKATAMFLLKRSMGMTGTIYGTEFLDFPISKWLSKFNGAFGCSLDLLSSNEGERLVHLMDLESSILFTITGPRIRVERRAAVGGNLPFVTNLPTDPRPR